MSFYGVYIPLKLENHTDGSANNKNVFTDKIEALQILKTHKEARLKVFKTYEDAEDFSLNGLDNNLIDTSGSKSPSVVASEKAPYRAPKIQELVQFRKLIESGNLQLVCTTITENPRFLVGSGDTPAILKEGTRYNALHVAALANSGKMCELILSTIAKPYFIQLLHGKKNNKICQEVSNILLDLYLNMPEKGRNETPLHLAVKYGYVEVIEVLLSYPQCRMLPNSEGLFPKDVICTRALNPSEDLKKQIGLFLEERFFVPVIRSVDKSVPPIIGEPFTPLKMPNLKRDPLSPEMEIQAYAGPMDIEQAQVFRRRWKTPPRVAQHGSPIKSPITNGLFTSPMRKFTPTKIDFHNSSTPIIDGKFNRLFPNKSYDSNVNNNNGKTSNDLVIHEITQTDFIDNKNCQNIDENLNNTEPKHFELPLIVKNKCPIQNYNFGTYRDKLQSSVSTCFDGDLSSLLNTSFNLSFNDGSFLENNDAFDSPQFKERHLKLTDSEKGLEIIGRGLAHEQNVGWKEYWHFLGKFVDISSRDGLGLLEVFLSNKIKKCTDSPKKPNSKDEFVDDLCSALKKLKVVEKTNHPDNLTLKLSVNQVEISPLQTSPKAVYAYSCIEKSCQVFAKRMTKIITNNIDNIVSINDSLNSELKRLYSLVCSYKDDLRFCLVEFHAVHSRFASLIVAYLKEEQILNDTGCKKLRNCFEHIIKAKVRFSSDELDGQEIDKCNITTTSQLRCLSNFIIHYMENMETIVAPETLTTDKDCEEIWNRESKCDCLWNSALNKNTKHLKSRNKRNELADVSRKLFDISVNSSEESTLRSQTAFKIPSKDASIVKSHDCPIVEENKEDDDIFYSGSESEDDIFYTPPESPPLFSDYQDSDDDLIINYRNYILGEEPTKTDVDVYNAICDTGINKNLYPNIWKWRKAIMQHTVEERLNFPSPSVVVKRTVPLFRTDDDGTPVSSRRLFSSPI